MQRIRKVGNEVLIENVLYEEDGSENITLIKSYTQDKLDAERSVCNKQKAFLDEVEAEMNG